MINYCDDVNFWISDWCEMFAQAKGSTEQPFTVIHLTLGPFVMVRPIVLVFLVIWKD